MNADQFQASARPNTTPVLVFDGECALCNRAVRLVLKHERRQHTLRFAPLKGEFGQSLCSQYPELVSIDSMIWYEPDRERYAVRSEAAMHVARYLGGRFRLYAGVARLLPLRLRDWLYRIVARHRHRLGAGGAPVCTLPAHEGLADRFLD